MGNRNLGWWSKNMAGHVFCTKNIGLPVKSDCQLTMTGILYFLDENFVEQQLANFIPTNFFKPPNRVSLWWTGMLNTFPVLNVCFGYDDALYIWAYDAKQNLKSRRTEIVWINSTSISSQKDSIVVIWIIRGHQGFLLMLHFLNIFSVIGYILFSGDELLS